MTYYHEAAYTYTQSGDPIPERCPKCGKQTMNVVERETTEVIREYCPKCKWAIDFKEA